MTADLTRIANEVTRLANEVSKLAKDLSTLTTPGVDHWWTLIVGFFQVVIPIFALYISIRTWRWQVRTREHDVRERMYSRRYSFFLRLVNVQKDVLQIITLPPKSRQLHPVDYDHMDTEAFFLFGEEIQKYVVDTWHLIYLISEDHRALEKAQASKNAKTIEAAKASLKTKEDELRAVSKLAVQFFMPYLKLHTWEKASPEVHEELMRKNAEVISTLEVEPKA